MVIQTEGLAVVQLHDEGADDVRLTGSKAANLARSARAGLPVLPGFVLVPDGRSAAGGRHGRNGDAVREAWRALSLGGTRPLVVRSSSAGEDTETSSMAGRFTSVLDVRGWTAFEDAVRAVLDSAATVSAPGGDGAGGDGAGAEAPDQDMAVLVQPMLRCTAGGVMFGADPVAGRTDRIVVSAVRGGPDALVGGAETGTRYRLTRSGRLLSDEPHEERGGRVLDAGRLRRLARLARRAARLFGGPQDVEFGFDADGALWLFQSRPITAMPARPPEGARLLGPGPVAETFPGVLRPLEEDLWAVPMSAGLATALDLAGAAPRRELRRHPTVTAVDGRAAADLHLLGAAPPRHRVLSALNPVPGARRLGAAWRMGRLRTTLPALAVDLMADVDRELASLGAPSGLGRAELVAGLAWGRSALVALHAQESLAGALLGEGSGRTAAAEALAVLAKEREAAEREGGEPEPDDGLIARHPVLLALLPPAVGAPVRLPAPPGGAGVPRGVAALPVREGLRLRVRWVQEFQARLLWELAGRLVRAGALPERAAVTRLTWPELVAAARGGAVPDLADRPPRTASAPLPAAFRLADGRPVPEPGRGARGGGGTAGQGAGSGRADGTAWDGTGPRPDGAVLVVRTLDPALAPLLPGLAALVAETGSTLSHLAVLAREYRVPTVVGVPGAPDRFPPGTPLTVDGTTGEVVIRTDGLAHVPDGGPADGRAAGGRDGEPGGLPAHARDRAVPGGTRPVGAERHGPPRDGAEPGGVERAGAERGGGGRYRAAAVAGRDGAPVRLPRARTPSAHADGTDHVNGAHQAKGTDRADGIGRVNGAVRVNGAAPSDGAGRGAGGPAADGAGEPPGDAAAPVSGIAVNEVSRT